MKFFNPYADIRMTQNHLPHWEQPGVPYFVTFRLADSIPTELLRELDHERRVWQELHPQPLSADEEADYHRRFSTRIDEWMDEGYGSCALRDPALRQYVEKSLQFGQGDRYNLLSWVIMPNHVHVLFILHPAWRLEDMLHGWKLHTARQIHQAQGKRGQFWQHDYFDRLIRDGVHLRNVVRYIRRNPTKARLSSNEFSLWESELAKSVS